MKEYKLKNISTDEILNNPLIYPLFNHAYFKELDIKCRILTGDFYLDSYNYYPITKKNFFTFPNQFNWQQEGYSAGSKFNTEKFKKKFFKKNLDYKIISQEIYRTYV